MEYVIEIQHNTIKKVQANYFCLLCDVTIKEKKGATGSNLDLMLGHIKSTAHRMKYLVRSHKRAESARRQRQLLPSSYILGKAIFIYDCF